MNNQTVQTGSNVQADLNDQAESQTNSNTQKPQAGSKILKTLSYINPFNTSLHDEKLIKIYTALKSFEKPNYVFDLTKYIHETFEHSLIYIKGSLLVFLSIGTILYHFMYKNVQDSFTLLHLEPSKIFLDAIITGVFGVLTIIFLALSRNGFGYFTSISVKTCLLVFTILFLFALAQEGSGLNRYLDKSELLNDRGIYYKYYKKHGITQQEIDNLEFGGDPFLKTVSYLFLIFIFIFVFYFIWKIINIAAYAYKNDIASINTIFTVNVSDSSKGMKIFLFIIEAIIAIGFNFIPVLISPIIRGEEKKIKLTMSTFGMLFIIVSLHIILQILGLL